MTLFARYYDQTSTLQEVSMSHLELFISKKNKNEISNSIYHRLYDRFLKPFFYKNDITKNYQKSNEIHCQNIFNSEYKSGFLMMASSCLLIETISAFLMGNDKTIGEGKQSFNVFFDKCKNYQNELVTFKNGEIYKNIRNGILHQGETYGSFIIKRTGKLFDEKENSVNATKFIEHLKDFLDKYIEELKSEKCEWDSELWDNCRRKVRFIIANTKKNDNNTYRARIKHKDFRVF